jgi:hypothetical protein
MRRRLSEKLRSGGETSTSGQSHPPEVTSNGVAKSQQQRMATAESKQVRKALRSILIMQVSVSTNLHFDQKVELTWCFLENNGQFFILKLQIKNLSANLIKIDGFNCTKAFNFCLHVTA